MMRLWIVCQLWLLSGTVTATELTFHFTNPNFGGNGNGTFLMDPGNVLKIELQSTILNPLAASTTADLFDMNGNLKFGTNFDFDLNNVGTSVGFGNAAIIDELGDTNAVTITQNGNTNGSTTDQTGGSDIASIAQIGSDNVANHPQLCDGNTSSITQNGLLNTLNATGGDLFLVSQLSVVISQTSDGDIASITQIVSDNVANNTQFGDEKYI